MHSRKPQRKGDGYFDDQQPQHYQKSNTKTERRQWNEYDSSRSRYSPLQPSNGHSSHAVHHHHGPDDRTYPSSKSYYAQKSNTSDRDRDYQHSRDKYTDSVKVHKDERNKYNVREHDRNDSERRSTSSGTKTTFSKTPKHKRIDSASSSSMGEWSEHISSSGIKYYYNSMSEVSQWEKPKDWDPRRSAPKKAYSSKSYDKRPNSHNTEGDEKVSSEIFKDDQSLQDMDISPDRSTPFSDNSYTSKRSNMVARKRSESDNLPPLVVLDNSSQQTGSLLAAALPKIVTVPPTTNNDDGAGIPSSDTCDTGANGKVSAPSPVRDNGPPTPVNLDNAEHSAAPVIHIDTALPKMESLGSYSTVVGSSDLNATPLLTPSLVNYVNTDLTSHVSGWPADILVKQADKFAEEAYQLNLQCARVSAELKCNRSLVRHREIQATLREQKIMYLWQQMSHLEELQSQNSVMY